MAAPSAAPAVVATDVSAASETAVAFAPYWLFYTPGLILLWLGTAAFTALMFGAMPCEAVFDTATLILASALVMTGYQMVCFHALHTFFATRFRLLPDTAGFSRLRSKK